MKIYLHNTRNSILAATLAAAFCALPQISFAAADEGSPAIVSIDNSATSDAAAKLNAKRYSNVKVSVNNGIATLAGSVELYEYKADAEKRIHKAKGVTAVRNQIAVAGPNVSDQQLQAKLQEKLAWDRVGYGNIFNSISVSIQNGAATLGGHARTDVDKDSAVVLVSTYPGVKDVIDKIEVDPTSIMDDHARMAVARAIYGFAMLDKYSNDPARPIRISVQNGHVELFGTVDSQGDKDMAYLRANGVSGVFSVSNFLQVANQPTEQTK
jgi:osmotically-inducible protein OsmY